MSLAGLRDGSALRRLGLVGACMLVVAFVLPALRLWKFGPPLRPGDDRQLEVTLRYSWDLLNDGHALALVYPLVGALVGFVVAFVPAIPTHVRASLLALVGLAGLVVGRRRRR